MPNVHAKIQLVIKADHIPAEIPGETGPESYCEPISGGEQIAYEVFKRIQEILPESVYGFVEEVIVLD